MNMRKVDINELEKIMAEYDGFETMFAVNGDHCVVAWGWDGLHRSNQVPIQGNKFMYLGSEYNLDGEYLGKAN